MRACCYPLRRSNFAIAALALLLSVFPISANAQDQKTALTDDPSRGDLFRLMGETLESKVPASDFSQFAFRANFRFPHDALWRNPVTDEDPRTNQTFGIDISHHTTDDCHCRIDWLRIADQKVSFVYLKASQGVSSYDRSFKPNVDGLRALPPDKKIAIGAFHFLSADGSAGDQAANFLGVVGAQLGADDLIPSLDLEWDVRMANGKVVLDPDGRPKDYWKRTDGKVILERVRGWLQAVKDKTGKTPIVYTNQTWWSERMNGVGTIEEALPAYPVWISDLSSKGLKIEDPYVYKGKYHLWQFSFTAAADNGGLPPGKKVDADVFQGDAAAFLAAMK